MVLDAIEVARYVAHGVASGWCQDMLMDQACDQIRAQYHQTGVTSFPQFQSVAWVVAPRSHSESDLSL